MPAEPGALYDRIGSTYAHYRRPDPRIAAHIEQALGRARTILDVGAGTGSYEPAERRVVAVEPSWEMIRRRPAGSAPVVRAVAERLPFGDDTYDAAMAILTIHHWTEAEAGLRELARVARRQVILAWDPAVWSRFWLVTDYLPQILEAERGMATVTTVERVLDVEEIRAIPVPWDCADGFCGAYWRRPEIYLDPGARASISGIARMDQAVVAEAMARLERDLNDGAWASRHGELRTKGEIDLGYRLIVAGRPANPAHRG